jgi:hypothetical protein
MTTPSFSVSRIDPICWSDCGLSLSTRYLFRSSRVHIPTPCYLDLALRRSSTCLTYTSLATNCAPWLDIHRNIRSPLLSMNVTSSRFTMQLCPWAVRRALLQLAFSSLTHGATRRPCSVHLSSVAVLVIVISASLPSPLPLDSANAGPEDLLCTNRDESLGDWTNKRFQGRAMTEGE